MKTLSLFLAVFLCQISFSQSLDLVELEDEITIAYSFIGNANESSYFIRRGGNFGSKKIARYNEHGVLISKEKAHIKKYKGAKTYLSYPRLFKNKLLYFGSTKERKGIVYWFVVEAELDGTIIKEPKELFAVEQSKPIREYADFKEIDGQLYFFLSRISRFKKQKSAFHVVSVDENLNSTLIFDKQVADEERISSIWYPKVTENFASFVFRNSERKICFAKIDFKRKRIDRFNFEQVKDAKNIWFKSYFIDEETKDIILIRAFVENNAVPKLKLVWYDKNFKKKKDLFVDISHLIAYGEDRTALDLIKHLDFLDVNIINGNWLLSFQYRQTVVSYRTTEDNKKVVSNRKRYFDEIYTLAVSQTSFRDRWTNVISRKQYSSWGLNGNIEEAHYLGLHIAVHNAKLYYIFNTHKDNVDLSLNTDQDKVWKRKSDSRIMMVELSQDGSLRSKILTSEEGSLFFEIDELLFDRKRKLKDARNGRPFIIVEKDGDFEAGYLNF